MRYKHVFEMALAARNADRFIANIANPDKKEKQTCTLFSFDMLGFGQSGQKFCANHGLEEGGKKGGGGGGKKKKGGGGGSGGQQDGQNVKKRGMKKKNK